MLMTRGLLRDAYWMDFSRGKPWVRKRMETRRKYICYLGVEGNKAVHNWPFFHWVIENNLLREDESLDVLELL